MDARSLIFRFEISFFDLCGIKQPQDHESREDCFIAIDVIFA